MANRSRTARTTVAARRWGPPAIMTLAAMAALTALTADAAARQARPKPPTEATAPRDAGEPIMAIVSIQAQQVTFYDTDGWILRAPVSTGTTGRETPAGIFAVVDKEKDHRSTLYDDAEMPNMQRITWNGIALHGGPLPGYAASHGCVRMPFGFAEKLFDRTRIGMRVIISPDNAEPVEFSHPALLVPNREAIAAAPARAEALPREAAEAAKIGRRGEESRSDSRRARRRRCRRRCASWRGTRPAPPPNSPTPTRRSSPPRRTRPRRGPRTSSKRPPPRPRNWGTSSTPPRPTRNRSSTPRRPPRKRPRRPRRGRPTPPRRRARRSSRSSRSRSISAARRRRFTCAAPRISRHLTAAASCSMQRLRCRSRSAIPKGRSVRMCSRRWRATNRACAGPRSPSTTETMPSPHSTASPSRRRCSIASRRPRCRDPRSSSRMSH